MHSSIPFSSSQSLLSAHSSSELHLHPFWHQSAWGVWRGKTTQKEAHQAWRSLSSSWWQSRTGHIHMPGGCLHKCHLLSQVLYLPHGQPPTEQLLPRGGGGKPMQHLTSSGASGTLARRCTGIMSAIFFPRYVNAFYSHTCLLLQMRVEEQTTHFLSLKHSLTYWDCCPGTSTFRHQSKYRDYTASS